MKISTLAGQYAKAIVAFVVPGVVALVAAITAGSPGGSTITGAEWVGIAAACVLTSGGVAIKGNTTTQRSEVRRAD